MSLNNLIEPTGPGRIHQDLAAERAVLGAVLTDNAVIANVAEVVHPDDFSVAAHTEIFSAMLEKALIQAGPDATYRDLLSVATVGVRDKVRDQMPSGYAYPAADLDRAARNGQPRRPRAQRFGLSL